MSQGHCFGQTAVPAVVGAESGEQRTPPLPSAFGRHDSHVALIASNRAKAWLRRMLSAAFNEPSALAHSTPLRAVPLARHKSLGHGDQCVVVDAESLAIAADVNGRCASPLLDTAKP